MTDSTQKIKICRHCLTIYSLMEQKFCGNGCERKPPYFIDNKKNKEINTPRVILLEKTEPDAIRWICLVCHKEFSYIEVKQSKIKCPNCNTSQEFYPFTKKSCNLCQNDDGSPKNLNIDALACPKCGKSEFLLNSTSVISDLKPNVLKQKLENEGNQWEIPNFDTKLSEKPTTKKYENQAICNFIILNNNCQYQLFGEGKEITLKDIIRDAQGYVPNNQYLKLITKYGLDNTLFQITYNSEKQEYSIKSGIDLDYTQLDTRYKPKKTPEHRSSGTEIEIPEYDTNHFEGEFFKIRIIVQ